VFAEAFFETLSKIAEVTLPAPAPLPVPQAPKMGVTAQHHNAIAALQKQFRGSSGGLFGKSPAMQPIPLVK
jgi:hypothetical protein